VAVDGEVWPEAFDMVWDPIFTPSGERVMAKVERGGRFAIVVDGKVWSPWFGGLQEPVASPDGTRVLIRSAEGDRFSRQVVPLNGKFKA
jgi:hypothetical protein